MTRRPLLVRLSAEDEAELDAIAAWLCLEGYPNASRAEAIRQLLQVHRQRLVLPTVPAVKHVPRSVLANHWRRGARGDHPWAEDAEVVWPVPWPPEPALNMDFLTAKAASGLGTADFCAQVLQVAGITDPVPKTPARVLNALGRRYKKSKIRRLLARASSQADPKASTEPASSRDAAVPLSHAAVLAELRTAKAAATTREDGLARAFDRARELSASPSLRAFATRLRQVAGLDEMGGPGTRADLLHALLERHTEDQVLDVLASTAHVKFT